MNRCHFIPIFIAFALFLSRIINCIVSYDFVTHESQREEAIVYINLKSRVWKNPIIKNTVQPVEVKMPQQSLSPS